MTPPPSSEPPPTVAPTEAPPRKRHGCFFYGCITTLVILLLLGTGIALLTAHIVKLANSYINNYTDTQPVVLPRDPISADDLKQARQRLSEFTRALGSGSNAPPLSLSGHEINGLLNDALASGPPQLQTFTNGLYVAIDNRDIKGQISVPVDRILHVPLLHTQGRYLNGAVAFRAVLTNQQLSVFIDSLEVKGQPLPEQAMTSIRQIDFAQGIQNNPNNRAAIGRFESIEIKDSKIIITPKKPEAP